MSSQAVAWAITMPCASPSQKAVLLSLANFANEYGECWQSQKTIAEGASLKPRQLRTLLRLLESGGLIERTKRGREDGGRETDLIRLRMIELPAIITAKRRPELEPETQAAKIAGSVSGKDCHGGLAAISEGVSGKKQGGYRQLIAGEINKPPSQDTQPLFSFEANASQENSPASPDQKSKIDVPAAVAAWNEAATRHGWAKVALITPARRQAIAAKLREHGLETWCAVIRHCEGQAWLTDPSKRNGHETWKANIDWFTSSKGLLKQLEAMQAEPVRPTQQDLSAELDRILGKRGANG